MKKPVVKAGAFFILLPSLSLAQADYDDLSYETQPQRISNQKRVVKFQLQDNWNGRISERSKQDFLFNSPEPSYKKAKDRRHQLEAENENAVLEEVENSRMNFEQEILNKFKPNKKNQ